MSTHSGSMCLETNINILKSQINDPQASTFIYFLINQLVKTMGGRDVNPKCLCWIHQEIPIKLKNSWQIYIYIYIQTHTQTLGSLKPECLDFTPKDMLLFLKNVEVHNMGINISQYIKNILSIKDQDLEGYV